MIHQAFVRKEVHAEKVVNPLYLGYRTGKKVPGVRVSLPGTGIAGENVGLVTGRVKSYSEQNQVATELLLEPLLDGAKSVGVAIAEVRQRAAGVDKVHGHHLAAKLRKRNPMAPLVD